MYCCGELADYFEDVRNGKDPKGILRANVDNVIPIDLADHLEPVEATPA